MLLNFTRAFLSENYAINKALNNTKYIKNCHIALAIKQHFEVESHNIAFLAFLTNQVTHLAYVRNLLPLIYIYYQSFLDPVKPVTNLANWKHNHWLLLKTPHNFFRHISKWKRCHTISDQVPCVAAQCSQTVFLLVHGWSGLSSCQYWSSFCSLKRDIK